MVSRRRRARRATSNFSALQFINPFSRRLKVYEFADMYAELLATPPIEAPIHYAGHSFGTYLLGRSLLDYPSMRFERAYLAGSVLHETFFSASDPEHDGLLGDRIQWLRNDIATADWPVGILCSGLDGLNLTEDVGTGGFDGFTTVQRPDRYDERRYYPGGHGKALEHENLASIASWLVEPAADGGSGSRFDPELLVRSRSYGWSFASRIAPALFLLILVGLSYLVLFGRRPCISIAGILGALWLLNIV